MALLTLRCALRATLLALLVLASTLLLYQTLATCNNVGELASAGEPPSLSSRQIDSSGNAATHQRRQHINELTRKHGYVLAIRFNGQQSAGIRSLTSLQCWVGSCSLPMYVVEPFIEESFVYGIANKSTTNALRLRDFFDIHRYNERTKEMGYRELASWEDFLQDAPSNVVIVRTKRGCSGRERVSPKVIWSAAAPWECGNWIDKNVAPLLEEKQFCVKKIVKFFVLCATDVIFTVEEMFNYIFDRWSPAELTVVIDYWTGPWHVPTHLGSPSSCKDSSESGLRGKLFPSRQLLSHSQWYERTFAPDASRFSVAVMVRSEQLLNNLDPKSIQKGFSLCLSEVLNLVDQNELDSTATRTEPFITVDVGTFGSNSRIAPYRLIVGGKKTVVRKMKALTTKVFGRNLTFEKWEESFTTAVGGIVDSGYIAALQRTIASRSRCLVLVGGGQFLKIALHQYLDLHPDQHEWCIRFVCVEGRFREEYEDIIAQQRLQG